MRDLLKDYANALGVDSNNLTTIQKCNALIPIVEAAYGPMKVVYAHTFSDAPYSFWLGADA